MQFRFRGERRPYHAGYRSCNIFRLEPSTAGSCQMHCLDQASIFVLSPPCSPTLDLTVLRGLR